MSAIEWLIIGIVLIIAIILWTVEDKVISMSDEDKKRDTEGGLNNSGNGMLVVAVHPDVAAAGVEALRGLTEKQMMGLICVATRIQNELALGAMNNRDSRNEMLDMSRGVGAMLRAVRSARSGLLEEKAKSSEVPK